MQLEDQELESSRIMASISREQCLDCDYFRDQLAEEVLNDKQRIDSVEGQLHQTILEEIIVQHCADPVPIQDTIMAFRAPGSSNHNFGYQEYGQPGADPNAILVSEEQFREEILGDYLKLTAVVTQNRADFLAGWYMD